MMVPQWKHAGLREAANLFLENLASPEKASGFNVETDKFLHLGKAPWSLTK